ncbi:MAG: dihydrolipoamide dehydrogenase [Ponticaulis sp.]|nr:dihydrolipoamide dehydrogenase [Ponticaulis sp.]
MSDAPKSERKTLTPDLAIIGAGSGGLSIASGAAQLGLDVVLFEDGEMGGDCLNTGCVPSKALLAIAHAAHDIRSASADFGIETAPPDINWEKVKAKVRAVIEEIAPVDSQERFEGLGVTVIRETAQFADEATLVSKTVEVKPRRIVIAAGSKAFVPTVYGLETLPYWTNETIFDIPDRPDHLMIMGGGPIGLELAQAFYRLGSKVTVIEMQKALGRSDPEHAAEALRKLRQEGITILEGHEVVEVSGTDKNLTLRTESAEGATFIKGDQLLIAVGRTPSLDKLNLDAGGVTHNKQGIVTKDNLRSVSNSRVWAVGDIAGRGQFTHLAGWHASIFVQAALMKLPAKAVTQQLPAVTYVDPEIGQIGMSEAEAKKAYGDAIETVEFPFSEIDRAITDRRKTGSLKLFIRKNGKIVGASILGQGGGDILQIVSVAMANKLSLRDLTKHISPYPTRAEIVKRAASSYYSPKLFSPLVSKLVGLLQRIP